MVIKVKNNGEWVKIPYLSSDNNPIIPEAPLDGKQYARQSGEWTVVNIPEVDFTEINQKISQNTAAIASNTTAIQSKVDKVDGFGLSSNDYTSQEKTKLAGLNNYTLPTASDTVKGGIKVGTGLTMNGEVLSATGGGMADSVEWDNVLSKPKFATVATSGAYNDLTGRPSLATVATSGSYADLSNKPTIPTVDVTKSYVDTQLATKANVSNVYTKAEVDSKVSSVYRVKGSVASYANLPTVDVTIGDVYNLEDTGANYVATSTTPDWDKLSETVDLNGYLTKTDAASTYQPKGNYLTSVPEEYVTETELNAKGYATTTQVNTKLDSSAYTATDVLSKVKTVDGVGSGLDADLLDGKQGNEYALKTEVITEAPSDGKTYGRKNKQWSEIIASNQYLDLTTLFPNESGALSEENYQKVVDAVNKGITTARIETDPDGFGPITINNSTEIYGITTNILAVDPSDRSIWLTIIAIIINKSDKTYTLVSNRQSLQNTGSGTKYLSDNGQYLTPPTATSAIAGYMSAEDKKKVDDIVNFGTGSNAVTTLANIPTNKRLIKATLSSASNLSINESARALNVGEEIYLDCNPTASFTQPIPTTGSFRSMSGSSITTTSGVPFEMSILKIDTSGVMYSITVKEKD